MNQYVEKIQKIILKAANIKQNKQAEKDMKELFADVDKTGKVTVSKNETAIVRDALDYFDIPYNHLAYADFESDLYDTIHSKSDWEIISDNLSRFIDCEYRPIEAFANYLCKDFKMPNEFIAHRTAVFKMLTAAQEFYGTNDYSLAQILQYYKACVLPVLKYVGKDNYEFIRKFEIDLRTYYSSCFDPDRVTRYPGLIWEYFKDTMYYTEKYPC